MSVWSKIHSPVYGSEYWKELLTKISNMWFDKEGFPHENIKMIKEPVLIVVGDRDEAISVEHATEMYRMIPNAQLAILPNAGSSLSREKYEIFSKLIINFFLEPNK